MMHCNTKKFIENIHLDAFAETAETADTFLYTRAHARTRARARTQRLNYENHHRYRQSRQSRQLLFFSFAANRIGVEVLARRYRQKCRQRHPGIGKSGEDLE